jgi:hypothetical protein
MIRKTLALALTTVALFLASLAGCGDSSGGAGGGSSSGTGSQTCTSAHLCVNGSCHCGSDGKGSSCTDDQKCESECQMCA